ncbi:hypothetical protein [Saccharothrix yanglingensis]|uniref:hypothetical protein n=1 Tax=Saccharothrix yanglingensis TaxID=659496 RepID=UPI0027D2ECCC|nr:hypothetical protein [Saccharothrix yanglingensis]
MTEARSSRPARTGSTSSAAPAWRSRISTPGVRLAEPGQHGGQVHGVQALDAVRGQRAAQQVPHGRHRVAGRVDRAQRATCPDQQRADRRGQPRPGRRVSGGRRG